MSDLLVTIRRVLPRGFPPDDIEDVVSEIAILVLSGRVREDRVAKDIHRFLPNLKKKYKSLAWEISLDQPLAEDTDTTLGEVVIPSPTQKKHRCPNCRRKVRPGNNYCSSGCALAYARKQSRKIDIDELRDLHHKRWLSNKEIAAALGVSVNSVNSAVSRNGLGRKVPPFCKIEGCGQPVMLFPNSQGNPVGNMCAAHTRQERNQRVSRNRRARKPPLTPEQRREMSRRASLARWNRSGRDERLRQSASLVAGRKEQAESTRKQQMAAEGRGEYLSYPKTMELLGISHRTLYRKITSGVLTRASDAPLNSVTMESIASFKRIRRPMSKRVSA